MYNKQPLKICQWNDKKVYKLKVNLLTDKKMWML